jgi:hypothetical protein
MPAQSSDTQMEQQCPSVVEPEGQGEAARPLARPDGGHRTGATGATRRDRDWAAPPQDDDFAG